MKTEAEAANSRAAVTLSVCAALAISLALQQTRLVDVWTAGGFYDTDDAMRMVQVRDLLGGQGWFDMTAWRVDPPNGLLMHWSRLVDIPIVLFLKFFSLFLSAEAAERAARIAVPTLTFAILLSGGAWAGRIFAGPSAKILGVFAVLFCGVTFWQFPPGRIDHHAQQITLLFFCVAALARALDPAQARWGALSGACMAASIGIGLENLPFFALVAGVPGLAFVLRGAEARSLLLSFAVGLAAVLAGVYLLTVGPDRWLVTACDALSPPWLVSALCGAAAYVALAFTGRLNTASRLAALCLLGAAALAPLLLVWRHCLGSPYADMDPMLQRLYLDHISENLTLRQNYAIAPQPSMLLVVPVLLGLCGAVFGAFSQHGLVRARWVLLAAATAVGFATACFCLRVFSSIMPLAALGLLAPVMSLRGRLAANNMILRTAAGFAALALSSAFGVAMALPDLEAPPLKESSLDMVWRRPTACLDSASYRAFADLPAGLAVTQIPAGAYFLAHTRLTVLAASYHRNNHGNRAALDILRAAPALAESLARKAGAKYLFLCYTTPADLEGLKSLSPDGLAAQVAQGKVPGWLRPLNVPATIIHAYQIMPPGE